MIGLFATALAAGLNMPCEQLASVKLERASITAATTVAEGIFTPPPAAARRLLRMLRRRSRYPSIAASRWC